MDGSRTAMSRAVVLLSGGLDSATVLAMARSRGFDCHALSIEVPDAEQSRTDAIPVTYVPARNTIMLSVAPGWAEVLGADDIFFGANAVDYSGYPDCRPEYVQAFERMANLATKSAVEGRPLRIQAPLIGMTKAEIIREGFAAAGLPDLTRYA